MTGFITMRRAATEHHLFDGDAGRFGAWVWLVSKACWKPTKFNVNGKTIILERGQYCCSVRDLAEAWGWSKSTVDRFLTRLKNETMIGTDTGTGRLVITICNYEKYQDVSSKSGTATGTPAGTAAGQQRDTKEPRNQEPNGSSVIAPTPIRDADWPEIPEWIPVEAWNGWLGVRREKKDWPTARAVQIAIKRLSEWKAKGHDPGDVLDNSTLNKWTGIFEPKEARNGNRNQQTFGGPSSGDRRPGPAPDGFSAAINDAVDRSRFGDPAEAARRPDAGAGDDTRRLVPPGS